MISPTDLLVRARELIDSPEKWIKGAYEVNGCYCAQGAMYEIAPYPDETFCHTYDLLMQIVKRKNFVSLTDFNDDTETTHEDIMNLFDSAIAKSREGTKS